MSISKLRDYLSMLSPGPVSGDHKQEVDSLLECSWNSLSGSSDKSMEDFKLTRGLGTENMAWNPPLLSFEIERHGAIVRGGSTRAELQPWFVDAEQGTAHCGEGTKYRQLVPAAPRLDVKKLAHEVAAFITDGKRDTRLTWRDENNVQVNTSEVIPKGFKQTYEKRSKRFWTELEDILRPSGWARKAKSSSLQHSGEK
jgi:hypothetical protein